MPKPENIIGKGFDKRPENINKKGRPKMLIRHINTELSKEGYEQASFDDVKKAYLTLINLPLSKIREISNINNDGYPLLYKLVSKEMTGNRGLEMLEKLLDRAMGKPQQYIDHTTKGESIQPQFTIEVEDKETEQQLKKLKRD